MPILTWFKGKNWCTTDAILMKLHERDSVMVIHIYFTIYDIMLVSFLVIAHFTDFQSIQQR